MTPADPRHIFRDTRQWLRGYAPLQVVKMHYVITTTPCENRICRAVAIANRCETTYDNICTRSVLIT